MTVCLLILDQCKVNLLPAVKTHPVECCKKMVSHFLRSIMITTILEAYWRLDSTLLNTLTVYVPWLRNDVMEEFRR